ncbi:MFS transporter [Beijerinckiaceae bacterium RH AL1]|nr:MFS transporter [Beijerinckiaceae bacterium]VVB49713.1 MFS transporter [Beijerinckiaceae bacterium RH CH11]VVB49790.1 MFS transporter [Beijerinckiaceae bacterium RH AL8]VVC57039.1 MFS transporter [Beijerinckiaceae bacterium RH AL1]
MSESGAGGATMGFIRGFLADRRQKAMLVLGFSQGIPYLLVYATQSAWLTEANVALGTLGILSELTLAYRLKFLWAPFLERYDAPILGRLLGRRRGWMVASQLGVVLGLVGIAIGNPATQLWWTILVSVALGFCGATQDVVIDGWRIASVQTERQALMTSIAETGYRIGILVSGAGALILSDHIGWHGSYFVMAAMMLPGMAAALYAPEPDPVDMPLPPDPDLFDTILGPFLELVRRLGRMAIPILIMIAGFRMPGYISNAMAIPLFKHLHYSNTDIGTVTKLVGFWIAIAGVFAAGIVVTRIGIMASLVIGTIAGSASHLALAYLAAQGGNGGHDYWTFAIAVGIDGFAASFAQIVLITYMSSISSNAFAGSQFGMLTSLVALPGSFLTMGSGFAAGHLGFPLFFTMTALIGLPIALLTIWVWRVEGSRGLSAAHRAPPAHPGLTAEEAPASAPP